MRRLGLTNPRKMPVEFSVAAFRFGHSEVRDSYELSELTNNNPVPVFSFTDPTRTLAGGRPIPPGFGVDWAYFFDVEGAFDDLGNLSRRFDTKISLPLFQLPIPGAEAAGSNVLAFRTMNRGLFYGLPSGQAVAKALKVKPIAPETLNLGPGFENGTPLWYYVLAEAQAGGGEQPRAGRRRDRRRRAADARWRRRRAPCCSAPSGRRCRTRAPSRWATSCSSPAPSARSS